MKTKGYIIIGLSSLLFIYTVVNAVGFAITSKTGIVQLFSVQNILGILTWLLLIPLILVMQKEKNEKWILAFLLLQFIASLMSFVDIMKMFSVLLEYISLLPSVLNLLVILFCAYTVYFRKDTRISFSVRGVIVLVQLLITQLIIVRALGSAAKMNFMSVASNVVTAALYVITGFFLKDVRRNTAPKLHAVSVEDQLIELNGLLEKKGITEEIYRISRKKVLQPLMKEQ